VRKSARLLGQDIGLSAKEMNCLLQNEGYLEGVPGNYSVTEKGTAYAEEEDHHRGTGGYSWYNRYWTTRTWDESILNELDITEDKKRQIRQKITLSKSKTKDEKEGILSDVTKESFPHSTYDAEANRVNMDFEDNVDTEGGDGSEGGAAIAVGLLLLYGAISAAPHVKQWWKNKAFPGIQRLGNKINRKHTKHTI